MTDRISEIRARYTPGNTMFRDVGACTIGDISHLLDCLDGAEAKIESIHKSLDFADKQRQRSKNYTELAINNGLALGQIAVTLQHEYQPLPAPPEEGNSRV